MIQLGVFRHVYRLKKQNDSVNSLNLNIYSPNISKKSSEKTSPFYRIGFTRFIGFGEIIYRIHLLFIPFIVGNNELPDGRETQRY